MYFMALFSFSPNHTPKTGTMLEYGLFFCEVGERGAHFSLEG